MDRIFKSIGTLCIIGYVSGLLLNFTSTNYTQKAIRMTAALYIITAFLTPLEKITVPEFEKENVVVSQQEAQRYVKNAAAENVKDYIRSLLDEKNISYTGINVHINEENEKIEIAKINICGTAPAQHNEILNIMEDIEVEEYVILEE